MAASNDEVWIAAGTYIENAILSNGIAMYGGFAGTESARDERDWVSNATVPA